MKFHFTTWYQEERARQNKGEVIMQDIIERYEERIQAWDKASASIPPECIHPKRNAVELHKALVDSQSTSAALLEALECNNDLLLTLSREALVREDYRCTVVADQIRDNYEAIRKATG